MRRLNYIHTSTICTTTTVDELVPRENKKSLRSRFVRVSFFIRCLLRYSFTTLITLDYVPRILLIEGVVTLSKYWISFFIAPFVIRIYIQFRTRTFHGKFPFRSFFPFV